MDTQHPPGHTSRSNAPTAAGLDPVSVVVRRVKHRLARLDAVAAALSLPQAGARHHAG